MAVEFYRRTIFEKQKTIGETLPKPYVKLANQFVNDIYQINPLTHKPITIETGNKEIEPRSISKELESKITEIVGLKTSGINPESEEGHRIKLLTRPISTALTTNTYIKSIHAESYLSFLGLSFDFAKNPQLLKELTIQTGFGGSTDQQTNLRIPAYAVPAIHILENIEQVFERYKIDAELPTIRFLFAPNTAIAINNSHMPNDQVLKNTAGNMLYLKKYIDTFHRGISKQIKMETDIPWQQHNEITKTTHHYFSNLLLNAQEQPVIDALTKLQKLGMHHGDENGMKHAHEYAAVHSFIFKDALEYPNDNYYENSKKPLFSISIGGRPERLFNIARDYIRKQSRVNDFIMQSTMNLYEQLQTWKNSLIESRAKYGNSIEGHLIHEGDKPLVSVAAITSVGAIPVYYATEYDLPVEHYKDKPTTLLNRMEKNIRETKIGQEKKLAMERFKSIAFDVETILADVKSEDLFVNFVNNL